MSIVREYDLRDKDSRALLLDRLRRESAATAVDLYEREARTDAGLDPVWPEPEPEPLPDHVRSNLAARRGDPEAVQRRDFAGRAVPPAPISAGLTKRDVKRIVDKELAEFVAAIVGMIDELRSDWRAELVAARAETLARIAGRRLFPVPPHARGGTDDGS